MYVYFMVNIVISAFVAAFTLKNEISCVVCSRSVHYCELIRDKNKDIVSGYPVCYSFCRYSTRLSSF